MASQEADLGASSQSAAALGQTKASTGSGLADTKLLETTVKEGQTLIDRFYNGGNRARPAALDILVVVLDGVVRRMRQQYATRQTTISEGNAQIAQIDASIAAIKLRQNPLIKELEEKKARAAELKGAVEKGESVILDSVETARAALAKASLLQRNTEKAFISGLKLCAQTLLSGWRERPHTGCAHAKKMKKDCTSRTYLVRRIQADFVCSLSPAASQER